MLDHAETTLDDLGFDDLGPDDAPDFDLDGELPDDGLGFDLEMHAEWLQEAADEDDPHDAQPTLSLWINEELARREVGIFGGPLAGLPTEADAEQAIAERIDQHHRHHVLTQHVREITKRTPPKPRIRARSTLSAGRPRAAARPRRGGDGGGDDPPAEPPEHDGVGRPDDALIRSAASLKGGGMRRHRSPRRFRADHRPLRPIEPPKLVAILLEASGRCWECNAPVTRTPSGYCSVKHQSGCRLLAHVEAMT